jgi:hypothetical protein
LQDIARRAWHRTVFHGHEIVERDGPCILI